MEFEAVLESAMQYDQIKLRTNRLTVLPFICQLKPFVCSKIPLIIPLICKKIPSVGYKGFTLIELIVTLTVVGILTTIAAPSIQKLFADNRLTSQVNDLMGDLSVAKSEAIKRNTTTGVCASTTGTSCTAGGNWASGWFVYYLCPATDTTCTVNASIAVKTHDALNGNNTLQAVATNVVTTTSSSADSITFGKNGALSSQAYTYRFTLCDPKLKQTRFIDLTVIGQSTISQGTC